jgi:hypothetical protein
MPIKHTLPPTLTCLRAQSAFSAPVSFNRSLSFRAFGWLRFQQSSTLLPWPKVELVSCAAKGQEFLTGILSPYQGQDQRHC